MDALIKVTAAAVAGSALGLVIKKEKPEMSLLLAIALSAFALYMSFELLSGIFSFLREVSLGAGIPNATLGIVLKCAGISVLTKFIGDVCKEAGQPSTAACVEFIGAATGIYVALPLFRTVLEMLTNLL